MECLHRQDDPPLRRPGGADLLSRLKFALVSMGLQDFPAPAPGPAAARDCALLQQAPIPRGGRAVDRKTDGATRNRSARFHGMAAPAYARPWHARHKPPVFPFVKILRSARLASHWHAQWACKTCARCGALLLVLAARHRHIAAIIVKAPPGLATKPASFDIFRQKRTGAIFR